MDTEKKERRKENPRATSGILSSMFLLYMVPIFWKTYRHGMKEEDLYEPLEEHKSSMLGEKLETAWKDEYKRHKKWALHKAMIRVFGKEFALIGIITLIREVGLVILVPKLIGKFVSYFANETSNMTEEDAYIYAGLIVAILMIERLLSHPSFMWLMHLTMKMRVACSSIMYRKTLRLNRGASSQSTVGQLVNLLSNDVNKFDQGFIVVHFSWVAPIQTAVGTYLMYEHIGISAFIGVGFVLLFMPLQMWLGKRTSVLRLRTALRTDERVRLMNEIISGMQVIKMYTWEKPFAKLISYIRRKEIQAIRQHKYLIGLMYSLEGFVSRVAIFISLLSFVLLGNGINAEAVFAITAIYNLIRTSITLLFSIAISSWAEVHVSLKRIHGFMTYPELPEEKKYYLMQNGKIENGSSILNGTLEKVEKIEKAPNLPPKVILKNVYASWSEEPTLENINVEITHSQLFAVIGPVGSGKTSLLNVILKELPISQGELQVNGKISFSAQEPWLFHGSVRHNILFGDEYDEERYKNVCDVCQLEADFALFPYSDQTLVGEKGNALSGGQRARINLARCIYKKADIYLLDDPLSAVDANVGKQLYRQCIKGFLKDKICILITHQLQYLKNADNILILNDGCVNGQGSYKELQYSGLDFAKLLQEFQSTDEETNEKKKIKSRQNSVASEMDAVSMMTVEEDEDGPVVNREAMESGKVMWSTYSSYFRAGGSWFVIGLLMASFIVSQSASNISDYYITYWVNTEQGFNISNETIEENESTRMEIIYEYSAVIIVTIIASIGHSIFFFVFFMRSSVRLHDSIFIQLTRATMRFFNTNLTGRILNRFSRDLGVIDEYIPMVLFEIYECGLLLLGAIILTSVVYPILIIPSIILSFSFYLMRAVTLVTSRTTKRIEGIKRSPIFTHITATMSGLSTIRAFSAQTILVNEFDRYLDNHSSAWFLFIASTRAFGFWIDLACVVFIGICIFTVLIISKNVKGGDMGLIITQYMTFMGSLQYGMRQWSELENQMVSAERILEYTKLENEPERDDTVAKTLPEDWPRYGKVEFKDLSLQYEKTDPPVLKNLNFTVHPAEKIGIVGRTGAGKSSIIVSLFQLYEVEGSILIDDVDTTKLPLNIVRSKIAIIPQEPVLFSGTMRKNLDPFDEYSDELLWNALEQVELKEVVADMALGLSTNVSEGGSNFSVGQRQLVCLARAIIRNNRILVLDEATANVDPHTDALIQQTIRRKFADCTVLTIAHRLHTVMDSDKILVMDSGRVVEFNHPYNLLNKDTGILKDMVETTGTANALYSIAEKSHEESKTK